MMNVYNEKGNPFLKKTKDLVPRIVAYNDTLGFCLVEKKYPKTYYCFLTTFGLSDRANYIPGDVIKKLSLKDYFKISSILMSFNLKFNLKKIIYDSNRNK